MNTNYHRNKAKAIYNNTEPSLTDQAAAKDTDINVIVKGFLTHGQAPGQTGSPMFDDFTQNPSDLREYIERARTLDEHRAKLPAQIRNLALEELLALTPETLRAKLTPVEPNTQPTPEGKA